MTDKLFSLCVVSALLASVPAFAADAPGTNGFDTPESVVLAFLQQGQVPSQPSEWQLYFAPGAADRASVYMNAAFMLNEYKISQIMERNNNQSEKTRMKRAFAPVATLASPSSGQPSDSTGYLVGYEGQAYDGTVLKTSCNFIVTCHQASASDPRDCKIDDIVLRR